MVQQYIEEEQEDNNPFQFCKKTLECGHGCKGVAGESQCLPCLKEGCIQAAMEAYDSGMEQSEQSEQMTT